MKMQLKQRALDKIYKRRDRYEIPDWQREQVWDRKRKQHLIDTILRGWRLPKFYFVELENEEYYVVDGQQRLVAIYEFFANELPLSAAAAKEFSGTYYKELPQKYADLFDDYEIEFDLISEATDAEQKEFFQRLQGGLPLTSSEKLNSIHSKLRDFCKKMSAHLFFSASTTVPNTRFAHFDIMAKAAVIEIEGIDAGLRYEDLKPVFDSHVNFSSTSAIAKRLKTALDFLSVAFPKKSERLKNRTFVQSVITLVCALVATNKSSGLEKPFGKFVETFLDRLAEQVELGQAATDYDFIRFQKSINANVKSGARLRHEVLLRKMFLFEPTMADAFGPNVLASAGLTSTVRELGGAIAEKIGSLNEAYSAKHGKDLFKATNRTSQALPNVGKPIKDLNGYKTFVDNLYFLFKESVGTRLNAVTPESFRDVNVLRTELQHDVDHGDEGKVKKKKQNAGAVFKKYAGVDSPQLLEPNRFVLVQANVLGALDSSLTGLPLP